MISVVVPAYNSKNTIKKCLNSICGQTYKDIEVIVVNNGSDDNTASIVKKMASSDERIKLHTLEKNFGDSYAINYGIDKAEGEYIAFLDSDNEWIENKLELQYDALIKNNSDVVFSEFDTYTGISTYRQPAENYKEGFISFDLLLNGNIISTQTVLGKSEVLKKHKLNVDIKVYEDWVQMLDILQDGYKVYYYKKMLANIYKQNNLLNLGRSKISESVKIILDKYKGVEEIISKLYEVFNRELNDLVILPPRKECEVNKISASAIKYSEDESDIFKVRQNIVNTFSETADLTIGIIAYNRLAITKTCIESILKNTKGYNYKLILVYNESKQGDGILEYFKSVDHDNKMIFHFSQNVGAPVAYRQIVKNIEGKYYVHIPNDVIVTPNWLSNLIKCAESDIRIGMVNPVSSNVSNRQGINLTFENYDQLQKKAAEYNVSDPTKWEERLRLITLGTLFKRECLEAVGNLFDIGFMHDFGDDDITFRVRRAGYKAILAGDTFVHHDHEDLGRPAWRLDSGRRNFKDKFFGIDAWDDVNNFIIDWIDNYITAPMDTENVNILGIDVKCGTPILEIKNALKKYGVFSPKLSGFSQESKYDIDLRTICDDVVCDRIDYIGDRYKENTFDYIILGNEINYYNNPEKQIIKLYTLLKENGQMFFKLKNSYNVFSLLYSIGYQLDNEQTAINYKVEQFFENIKKAGIKDIYLINQELYGENKTISDFIIGIVESCKPADANKDNIINKLLTDKYWFKIEKRKN